jgi:hypothetical protein
LYILYRRVFASVQHTFLTCVVYTSLISRNVRSIQRYSQIKIVIRIHLLRLNTTYINQTLNRFCFVQLFIKLCLKVINITGYVLHAEWGVNNENRIKSTYFVAFSLIIYAALSLFTNTIYIIILYTYVN